MDPSMRPFADAMLVIVASVASFVVIGLVARILWRMGSRTSTSLPSADSERLQQLERSVDAIAIEVERISEGQRFAVALLADRLPGRTDIGAPGLAARARHDTPH